MQQPDSGRFPDLFGDWAFEPGTVTDLWGLVLGASVLVLTIWLARRQLQIMNQQTAMMQEQSEAAKRQERIALEQSAIAKRQHEIVEKQDRIMQEQLAKQAVLSLTKTGGHTGFVDDELIVSEQQFVLAIENTGTRPARDIYWMVCAPWEVADNPPTFAEKPGSEDVTLDKLYGEELEEFPSISGRYPGPVYPGQRVDICILTLRMLHELFREHKLEYCEYALTCDDGRFPPTGMARLDLRWFVRDESEIEST